MNMVQLREVIEDVLLYCWPKEETDYKNCNPEDRENHIFHSMVKLDNFIYGGELTAEDYLGEE